MIPQTWLYRHDKVVTERPYAFDVDEQGWLWEGCGRNRIVGHNLRTNALRVVPVPQMRGRPVFQAFAWEGKLVLVLGEAPFYLVFDPTTGTCLEREIPAERATVWYGTKTLAGKVVLFERSESRALVLDAPDAQPRAVACPFDGQLAMGVACSDGLIYSFLHEPARVVRFDPELERFVDEAPMALPEASVSGSVEHAGVLYCPDSAKGRLLPLELATGRWLDPIPTPDYGELYGYIGGGFGLAGKAYFCLSTYRFPSRLDAKSGKLVLPEGWDRGVDRRPPRFLDRLLAFDPATGTFDYLVAPRQPDGIPLLCYAWTDGERFAVTGIVIPFARPGEPGEQIGPWLILQSEPAAEEAGFGPHDVNWDRSAHVRTYRRSYGATLSLYLPHAEHSPPVVNMQGPATHYSPGRQEEMVRRAGKTDSTLYWKDLAASIVERCASAEERVRSIAAFVQRALYYNPIQEPQTSDPIAVLESHDGRCGHGVAISLALLEAAGIECRQAPLSHHVVAEANYDGSWHMVDALFFGGDPPASQGRVLSVEELKADPYFADAWPQECFAYDPELLLSEDGYQILGYCFGPWGSQPYYSYYVGGERDCPPTLPSILPVQRAGEGRVRLRWTESVKLGGGTIEYDARVFGDRGCTEEVFRATTDQTRCPFDVPGMNRMYFVEVRALDDHRTRNPDTWYPAARSNFVLVPADQYGWYGVM